MLDDEIRSLEEQLLTPAVRASREELDRLLSEGMGPRIRVPSRVILLV